MLFIYYLAGSATPFFHSFVFQRGRTRWISIYVLGAENPWALLIWVKWIFPQAARITSPHQSSDSY